MPGPREAAAAPVHVQRQEVGDRLDAGVGGDPRLDAKVFPGP